MKSSIGHQSSRHEPLTSQRPTEQTTAQFARLAARQLSSQSTREVEKITQHDCMLVEETFQQINRLRRVASKQSTQRLVRFVRTTSRSSSHELSGKGWQSARLAIVHNTRQPVGERLHCSKSLNRRMKLKFAARDRGFGGDWGGRRSSTRVLAQTDSTAFRLDAEVLTGRLHRCPQLVRHLQRFSQTTAGQLAQISACNRLLQVDQRLAGWLLMSEDRIGSKVLPPTQDFLVQMLGTRRAALPSPESCRRPEECDHLESPLSGRRHLRMLPADPTIPRERDGLAVFVR
jgi:CRP-like cAMP-binding protein